MKVRRPFGVEAPRTSSPTRRVSGRSRPFRAVSSRFGPFPAVSGALSGRFGALSRNNTSATW
eukprot:9171408-Pyramimonas_sp.AAC.1